MSKIWTAPEDTALIIVDPQNDFCPGGNLAVEGGDEIMPLLSKLKRYFNMVVVTKDFHPPNHKSFASNHDGKAPMDTVEMPYGTQVLWPDHCVQGSAGAEFHAGLEIASSDLILEKGKNPEIDSYSGFFENDGKTQPVFKDGRTLTQTLKDAGIRRVVFAGLAYDFCVGWHALDALKEGFNAIVVKDATRAIAIPGAGGMPDTETAMTRQLEDAGAQIITKDGLFGCLDPEAGPPPLPNCS